VCSFVNSKRNECECVHIMTILALALALARLRSNYIRKNLPLDDILEERERERASEIGIIFIRNDDDCSPLCVYFI
jgi:hypothetical protein